MAREIKDEIQGSLAPVAPQAVAPPISPIQIPITPDLEETLIQVVSDDFDKAKSDRDGQDFGISSKGEKLSFDAWMKELLDLYSGYREAKDIPWKFCSNRSLRIGTAILEMLHSRLFSGVYNEDLTRWKPGEITDTPKVERISKFMDWWVRVWAPMRDFFDNWVKYTAGLGDSLTETNWDVEELESSDVEELPVMDEMDQPLINLDGQPAMQKVIKPKRYERTKSRIIQKENVYLMKNSKDIQRDPVIIEEEFLFKDLESMEKRGQAINITQKLAQKIVVPIPSNVSDPLEIEKIRKVKIRNVPVKVLRWYGHYDVEGNGFENSVRLMVSRDHQIYMGGVRMRDVTKSGRRPIEFAKYSSYLDKIDALHGEGVLDQVKELAEEIDAIFNQLTDANTLSVLRPGFYDPSGDLDAPALKIAPNRMVPVSNPSQNVYFPEFNINTDRLLNSIKLVMEFIERLTAASSYVMGKESDIVGGSGTATRTTAILQSAEIRFTRPVERLKSHAARIITNTLDLIQLNIPAGMETRVLGEKGEQLFQSGELTDDGISGQFDAYILNDPTLGSKATERELASMLYSLMLQNVIVGTDAAKIYRVTAKLLKAYGVDPVEILGPAPTQDDIDDPEDENTLMLQGDFLRVRPNMAENHIYHIQKHQELLQSPTFQMLSQTMPALAQQVQEYLMQHIAEHNAMMSTMMGLMAKVGGGGGGKTQSGSENGGKPTDPSSDPNRGMDNTGGALAQTLATKRNGAQVSPTQSIGG